VSWLAKSKAEYELAVASWTAYVAQDESAPDAYRSRFLLVDAMRWVVRIQFDLHNSARAAYSFPDLADIEHARAMAVAVRDTVGHDEYLDDLATYVVDLTDLARDIAYAHHEETGGPLGFGRREYPAFPRLSAPDGTHRIQGERIPDEILASMRARAEYVNLVPPEKDRQTPPRSIGFRAYNAEMYFVYSHFKEARALYEPLYRERCQLDESGYTAWTRLVMMSHEENDATTTRQLLADAKTRSCAMVNGAPAAALQRDESAWLEWAKEDPSADFKRMWPLGLLVLSAIGRSIYKSSRK
jgi:hypothetical protein